MTVLVTQPAKNLREELASLKYKGGHTHAVAEFTGDSTAVSFAIQAGWKPYAVYSAGARKRKGASEDYTVTFDGHIYTVVFAVAPAAVNIDIDIEVAT